MTDIRTVDEERRKQAFRALRQYSSSALAELKPHELEDWAGASRVAIDGLEQLHKEVERLRGALRPFAECELDYSWQPDLGGGRIHLKGNGAPPAKAEFDEARAALTGEPSLPGGLS